MADVQREPEHIRRPVLDELIRIAATSFSEEELFYLADGFDAAGHMKYRSRLEKDESWLPEELRG